MTEPQWKEVKNQNRLSNMPKIYWREFPDGSQESCTEDHPPFKAWLEEGNTPLPPDPEPTPEPLTPQQKLEAAGLSIEELKELLGL